MALIFMDGFDAADTGVKWTATNAHASSTLTRFSVGRSVFINQYSSITQQLPSAVNTLFITTSLALYNPTPSELSFLYIYGDTGTTVHLALSFTSTGIVVRRGVGGTIIATCNFTFSNGIFHTVEVMATVADSGGICKVRINGVLMIDYTGDTKNGGTNTTLDMIMFYMGNNGGIYLDDFVLYDATGSAPYNDFLGDVRVHTSVPTAAGNYTQFTPSSGANYTTVDELPYSATDYVSAINTGTKDTYQMSDLTTTPNSIFGVQTNIVAKKVDAGPANIRAVVRSGGVDYTSPTSYLIASDRTITHLRTDNPNTSAAWTAGGVNNVEIGMEIV